MKPFYNPEELAEQAGAMIGYRLLDDLLRLPPQSESGPMIREAIADLNHPAAVAGFVVVVGEVLMNGIRNLPPHAEGDDE